MPPDRLEAGIAALRNQNFDEAERIGRNMLDDEALSAGAHHVLGCALVFTARVDEGIPFMAKAAELSASSFTYARNLVSQLCRSGRFGEANKAVERFRGASSDNTKIADLQHLVDQASGSVPADHTRTFEEIYRSNAWNSGSGFGSTVEATQVYRGFLQDFLRLNAIASVVDLGCGDWTFSRLIDWTGVEYTGVDVSETALARAKRYQSDNVRFVVLNAMTDCLPSADLLIVKDVLQHWPNEDILLFLGKLKEFDRALITNRFSAERFRSNCNSRLGDVRAINLAEPPFSLRGSNVLRFLADESKAVFLWQK